MSTRKLKGFRFFKETISKLNSVAKDYGKDEATIVEAALSHHNSASRCQANGAIRTQ